MQIKTKIIFLFAFATFWLFANAQTPTETYTVTDDLSLSTHSINGSDFPSAIVTYKGCIYYGYIDPSLNGCIAKKDKNGVVTTKIVMTGMTADDNHNEVAIAVDVEGYIHWTGNMHQTPMVYYKSTNPEDISTFQALHGDVANGGIFGPSAVSYGRFVQSRKGTLFYISRQRLTLYSEGWVPGDMAGTVQKYNINTHKWEQLGSLNWSFPGVNYTVYGGMDSDPTHNTKAVFWDNSGAGASPTNGYQGYKIRIVFDKNNRMHMVWNVAKNPLKTTVSDTHTHLMYAYSDDEGITWKKSNGTTVSLPITTANGEVVYMEDPNVNANRMYNFCNIMLTSDDKPVLMQFSYTQNKTLAYKFNGTSWADVTSTWLPAWPGEGYTDDNGWTTLTGPTYGSWNRRSNDNGATWKDYSGFLQMGGSHSLDYQYFLETGNIRYQYQSGSIGTVKTLVWQNTAPGQVAMPEITPLSGTSFSGATTITLVDDITDATIRYTTDGSEPSATVGTIYTGPFSYSTSGNATIKAIAYKTGKVSSRISVSKITITGTDTQAPTVPSNLASSSITQSSFTLSWTASTDNVGVASYDVYKDGVLYGNTASTSTSITGLSASTSYSMTVKAKDAAGNVSAASSALNVTTSTAPDTQAPTAPTGLASASITATSFTLSWTASTDNIGVASYDVYKDGSLYGNTAATSISVAGLTASTSYSMTVVAKDVAGNASSASTAFPVSTIAAGYGIFTTDADFNVPVAGSTVYSSGTYTVNGSYYAYSTYEGFHWVYKDVTGDFTITSRIVSTTMTQTAGRGFLIARNTSATNDIFAAVGTQGTSTGELRYRTTSGAAAASTTVSSLSLASWYRLTRVGNSFVGEYSADGISWTRIGAAQTITMGSTIKVGLLVSSNETVNKSVTFDNVSITGAVLDLVAPTAPIGLASASVTETNFTLNWTASTDNVAVTSYDVYKDGILLGNATTTSYSVAGLTASTTYAMTVKAKDAAGNVSAASSALNVTTSASGSLLTGTSIGTTGSYSGTSSDTRDKAYDGVTSTIFDGALANGNWTGLDLGNNYQVTQIRFFPRSTYESRMTNGIFQGSNTADFSTGVVDLYTISTLPAAGWSGNIGISNTSDFRYVRYLSPSGSYGNVAEIEFYGTLISTNVSNLALNIPATASSQASTTYSAGKAVDGNASTQWRSTSQSNPWIYVDLGTTCTFNRVLLDWSTYYGTAYTIQASADASNWTTVSAITGQNGGTDDITGISGQGRYVRINVTGRSSNTKGIYLINLEVYGSVGAPQSARQVVTGDISDSQAFVSIYPTYVTDHFTINNCEKNSVISIVGVDGRVVYNYKQIGSKGEIIRVNNWTRGLYLVRIQSGENTIVKKIIVSN